MTQLNSVYCIQRSPHLEAMQGVGIQDMPLNESPHVAHFWVYTLRKLFPVSDTTPRIKEAQRR